MVEGTVANWADFCLSDVLNRYGCTLNSFVYLYDIFLA